MNEFYKNLKFNYFISIFLHLGFLFINIKKDDVNLMKPILITDIQYFKLEEKHQNKKEESLVEKVEKTKENIPKQKKLETPHIAEKKEIHKDKILVKNKDKNNEVPQSKISELKKDDDDEILTLSTKVTPKKIDKPKNMNTNNKIEFEKNFPFDYYIHLVIKKITETWQVPFIPTNARCVVYFKIHKNGSLSDIRMHEYSKYKEFDESAISSIMKIKSFPPLPMEYKEEFLGVFFYFEFA